MKRFIWNVAVFLLATVIILAIDYLIIPMGTIPMVLCYVFVFFVANRTRDKIAANNFKKKASNAGMTPFEYAMKDIPKMFRLEIESRIERNDGLSGYLTMCVKEKIISKEQADAILAGDKK